jgi:hypothetical protein
MRFQFRTYRYAAVFFLVLLGMLLGGCNSQALKSVWLKPTSVVQGTPDWWNLPAYRIEDLNGSLTLVNDSSTMHLRFYSSDRQLAGRFKRMGMTLWLINPKDKADRVGIRYPMGMERTGLAIHPNRYLPSENLPPSEMDAMLKLQSDDVVIEAKDSSANGRKTPEEAAQLGVQPRLIETENAVEYQLAVTMHSLAPWIMPGAQILMELDSPLSEHGPGGRNMHGSPAGGGEGGEGGGGGGMGRGGGGGDEGGGMGGGGGGMGGGRRGGGRHGEDQGSNRPTESTMNKTIHYQFTVELASGPAQP